MLDILNAQSSGLRVMTGDYHAAQYNGEHACGIANIPSKFRTALHWKYNHTFVPIFCLLNRPLDNRIYSLFCLYLPFFSIITLTMCHHCCPKQPQLKASAFKYPCEIGVLREGYRLFWFRLPPPAVQFPGQTASIDVRPAPPPAPHTDPPATPTSPGTSAG